MNTIQTVRAWFTSLEQITFRNYMLAAFGVVCVLSLGLTYYYYHSVNELMEKIEEVNENRKQVRKLITNVDQVRQQQKLVRKMVEENIDFKITGYLTSLLSKLGLRPAEPPSSTQIDQNEQYREDSATTTLTGISMKEVAQLLQELEKTEKIYLKELSIVRDKKRAGTVRATIQIGTFVPKATTGSGPA